MGPSQRLAGLLEPGFADGFKGRSRRGHAAKGIVLTSHPWHVQKRFGWFSFFVPTARKSDWVCFVFFSHWRCREKTSRQIMSKARSDIEPAGKTRRGRARFDRLWQRQQPASSCIVTCQTQLHSVWTTCAALSCNRTCFVISVSSILKGSCHMIGESFRC